MDIEELKKEFLKEKNSCRESIDHYKKKIEEIDSILWEIEWIERRMALRAEAM